MGVCHRSSGPSLQYALLNHDSNEDAYVGKSAERPGSIEKDHVRPAGVDWRPTSSALSSGALNCIRVRESVHEVIQSVRVIEAVS